MNCKSVVLLLVSALAACQSSQAEPDPTGAPNDPGSGEAAPGPVQDASWSKTSPGGVGEAAGASASAPRRGLSAESLAIFRSPEFQKRFAESYLAETDVEPGLVDEDERESMAEVVELIAANKLSDAASRLESVRGPTKSAAFDFTLAHIRFEQEQLDKAVEAYRAAVEKFPSYRRAWQGLGTARFRMGEFREAYQALSKVVTLGGGNALTYGLLGIWYTNLDEHVAAESAFRMATLLDPTDTNWKLGLAESFFKQRKYADVVSLCQSLINEKPDSAKVWEIQGNAYVLMKQPLKAAENYEFLDRLGESTPRTLGLLASIYVNEKLYGEAVRCYTRVLEQDPKAGTEGAIRAAKILSVRGALQETKELVASVESVRTADLTDEERKDLLRLRARVAVAEGADDEQARVLEQIIQMDPLDGDALILLGRHAGRQGKPEVAANYFEQAAQIEVFEKEAKLQHARLLVGNRQYREALPLLRRAHDIDPREDVRDFLEQVERAAQAQK